jgi:hypothetical protein
MKDKYYTPSIEEFYVGFEFELFIPKYGGDWAVVDSEANKWHKNAWEAHYEMKTLREELSTALKKSSYYRVKYLDQEDIESLGWEAKAQGQFLDQKDTFTRFQMHYYTLLHESTGRVCISDTRDLKDLFIGTIKNKSELKKLMKQLGI